MEIQCLDSTVKWCGNRLHKYKWITCAYDILEYFVFLIETFEFENIDTTDSNISVSMLTNI